jgi:hypothetical protein
LDADQLELRAIILLGILVAAMMVGAVLYMVFGR